METSTPHPENLSKSRQISKHTRRGSTTIWCSDVDLYRPTRGRITLLQGVPLLWGPQRPASSIAICVSDLTASTCYLSSCELFLYLSSKSLHVRESRLGRQSASVAEVLRRGPFRLGGTTGRHNDHADPS